MRRAAKIAKFLDHLLAILPFEPPYFEAVGLPCSYVGHAIVEEGAERGDGPAFLKVGKLVKYEKADLEVWLAATNDHRDDLGG